MPVRYPQTDRLYEQRSDSGRHFSALKLGISAGFCADNRVGAAIAAANAEATKIRVFMEAPLGGRTCTGVIPGTRPPGSECGQGHEDYTARAL